MEKLQGITDHVMLYVKTLVKWLLAAALIGTVGGAVGSLFHLGVEYATELRTEVPALLYALPLAGVLIVALYRFLRTQGVGTNAVLDAVHQGRELPILLIPAIFLATLLTHLAGGSAGREGAALQIGGDLGEHFGKMLRMDDKDCRLATLCGMSALFSALFGTPLAAVFFALEVVSTGVLYYSGLIPCITSSLVAYAVSLRFGIEPMRFAVAAPETGALTLARAVVLALGCALVSILFCEMLHRTEHLTERLVKNDYLRAFLGGCLVIALTLLAGAVYDDLFHRRGRPCHRRRARRHGEAGGVPAQDRLYRRYARLRLQGRRDRAHTLCRLDLRLRGGSAARPARGLCRGARHHGSFLRHDELPHHLAAHQR